MTRLQIRRWTGLYIAVVGLVAVIFSDHAELIVWTAFAVGGATLTGIVLRLALIDEAALKRNDVNGTAALLVKTDRVQQVVILFGQFSMIVVSVLAVGFPLNQAAQEILAWLLVSISVVLAALSLNSYLSRIELEAAFGREHNGDDNPAS